MKPDMILQSDMLDILFEGRNKDYGAYHLRRHYNHRLAKALGAMLLLVLLFAGGYYWAGTLEKETVFAPLVEKTDVVLKMIDPEKPLEPKPLQPLAKKVATIRSVTPVIVPDHVKADPPPSTDVLEKDLAAIGTETSPGEVPEGPVSPPAARAPGGTGTAPAAPAPMVEEDRVLPVAEKMPEFPGGQEALRRFLGRNLRVPEEVLEAGQRVRIPVRFIVSKDGQLSGVEFLATADEAFKKEIMRVVNKMPRWIPGSQGGKTVAVYCMIPIIFEVSE